MDRKILKRKAKLYNRQEGRKFPCSSRVVLCGIITDDRDKALLVMNKKGATIKLEYHHRIEWVLNNERWLWRNWDENCKGYKFRRVIVDENVDEIVFRYFVLPCCTGYCCSMEII